MHSMVVDRISKHSKQYKSIAVMGLEMSYPAVGILKSGYIHHRSGSREIWLVCQTKVCRLIWFITVPRDYFSCCGIVSAAYKLQ